MSDKPQKMNLNSMDISEEKRKKLKELFPEVFNEEHIDFDQLKRVLGEWVEPKQERFGLNWPGKAECMKVIQAPAKGTLKPYKEESINWDTTENLFIEGDNLEVLKLLQKTYFGKVKMIYIDPPYNTGKEFIYPDKYSEGLDTYLRYTDQKDSNGHKFSTNSDTNGRFHSRWLNMMYPRLYLAKNLLCEDGVIFISIDDNEQANLKKLCDQIFGEENFIEIIIWKKRGAPPNDKCIGSVHEYILVFSKNITYTKLYRKRRSTTQLSRYKNPDNHPKGPWASDNLMANVKGGRYVKSLHFPIRNPNTGEDHYPSSSGNWRFNRERIQQLIDNNEIDFGNNGKGRPKLKRFLSEVSEGVPFSTLWDDVPHNSKGSSEIANLLGNLNIFDTAKPTDLIIELIKLATKEKDIILDFFAGSASTAHAVMNLNNEDSGNRKFIMVQLPEPCLNKSEAFKAGYKTVADIGKERIRRVIKDIKDKSSNSDSLDLGFKVLKLDKSCFKEWDSDPNISQQMLLKQIEKQIDYIDSKASTEDILYELILKDGLSPTTSIKKLSILGKTVYSIEKGALLICLDRELTEDFILKLVETEPTPKRVICLDAGFRNNDQLKTNAVHTFKTRAHHKETTIDFLTI